MSDQPKATVAVTGVSGYLGSHVAKVLLDRGYTVRGTVRSLDNKERVTHLKELLPAVQLYEADLLTEGSFDKCFDGCSVIMHTASPFTGNISTADELLKPAIDGTMNVMKAALKANSVQQVVLTSSVAAVCDMALPKSGKYTEKDWNETSDATKLGMHAYRVSKTRAEKAAWDFVEEHKAEKALKLAVINPSFIIGPPLSTRADGTSIGLMKGMLNGDFKEKGANAVYTVLVDVRDVAEAHVNCLELEGAWGHRHITTSSDGKVYSHLDVADMLREKYGNYPLPTKTNGEALPGCEMDTTRLKEVLKIDPIPPKRSLEEMAAWMIDNGMIKKPE